MKVAVGKYRSPTYVSMEEDSVMKTPRRFPQQNPLKYFQNILRRAQEPQFSPEPSEINKAILLALTALSFSLYGLVKIIFYLILGLN
jgi:hypothetical protein